MEQQQTQIIKESTTTDNKLVFSQETPTLQNLEKIDPSSNNNNLSSSINRIPLYKKQYINIHENPNTKTEFKNARYHRVKVGEEKEQTPKEETGTQVFMPNDGEITFSFRDNNMTFNQDDKNNQGLSRVNTNDKDNNKNKFRNTISGHKSKFNSDLIGIILDVEKQNVKHYLSGELANLYQDITKDNQNFKEDVFLANVDNFDKKTGILTNKSNIKRPTYPYPSSNTDVDELLNTFNYTEDIIHKFSERSKKLQNDE